MKESARDVLHRFLRMIEVNDFLDDDRDAGGVVEVATAAWVEGAEVGHEDGAGAAEVQAMGQVFPRVGPPPAVVRRAHVPGVAGERSMAVVGWSSPDAGGSGRGGGAAGEPFGQYGRLAVVHVLAGGQQGELVVACQLTQMLGCLLVSRVA
jgi:hypothetical protein